MFGCASIYRCTSVARNWPMCVSTNGSSGRASSIPSSSFMKRPRSGMGEEHSMCNTRGHFFSMAGCNAVRTRGSLE
jgi:hypothetical protein